MTDAIEGLPGQAPLAALWPEPRSKQEGRAYSALRRAGIHDLGALVRCSGPGLLEVNGIGPVALEEVRCRLSRLGLALRGERTDTG